MTMAEVRTNTIYQMDDMTDLRLISYCTIYLIKNY